jgi:mRNA deadenylase 3'-5' endonuclease subunit Ccr4
MSNPIEQLRYKFDKDYKEAIQYIWYINSVPNPTLKELQDFRRHAVNHIKYLNKFFAREMELALIYANLRRLNNKFED